MFTDDYTDDEDDDTAGEDYENNRKHLATLLGTTRKNKSNT